MKIDFNNIINFIQECIDREYTIQVPEYTGFNRYGSFIIFNNKNEKLYLEFDFTQNTIYISGVNRFENTEIKHNFTDREKLAIDNLRLSAKEMNEQKVIDLFNNYFTSDNIPNNIDSLNDDD